MLLGPDGREIAGVEGVEERESLADITRAFLSGQSGGSPTSPSTAYRKTAMVFASVRAIGNTIAQLPFVVERGETEAQKNDPISTLFRRPGPGSSRFNLWYGMIGALELAGNSLWRITTTSRGFPTGIQPLNPRRCKPLVTKDGSVLLGYQYETPAGKTTLSVEEVVHFKYWNDQNPWWGLSTLEAAMLSVETDTKARRYNASFFDNSATLGGLLIAKGQQQGGAGKLQEKLDEKHRTPARAHRTLVLGGDYSYYQIGIGQRDMDFLGMLNDARDTINAVFNVPGILTNNPNNRNFATAYAELQIFHLTNWGPKLIYIEDELENQFFSRFAPEYVGYFDKDDAPGVGGDLDAVMGRAEKLWRMGATYNDIIEFLDLPLEKKPWGDVWYMPVNLAPTSGAPTDAPAADPGNDPAADPAEDPAAEDPATKSFRRGSQSAVEAARTVYWRGFHASLKRFQDGLTEDVSRHFGRLRAETLGKIAAEGDGPSREPVALSFNLVEADRAIRDLLSEVVEAAMVEGGNQVLADLSKDMDFKVAGADGPRLLQEQLEDVSRLNQTVHDALTTALSAVIKAGGGPEDLAAAAKRVFSKATNRAKLIAWVESHRALNAGRALACQREAVPAVEWISSRDGDKRHSHAIDGEVVKFGSEFSTGLRWPGDVGSSGSTGENLIGCGCTFLPVLEDGGEVAE